MYRFALKPRWLLSHLLVLVLVVVMVSAGLWQLRRLADKRDFNALVRARSDVAAAPVSEVLPASAGFTDDEDVVFRAVTASGAYLADEQVAVRNRTFEGKAGSWLLTPLLLDDGSAVVVNRGWVPLQAGLEIQPEWAPPEGRVRVEGLLVATQTRGRFGTTDPADGRLDTLARADVGRIQRQVDQDLVPAVLQLDTQEPAQPGDFPVAVGPPELSEGPHLNYAGQWFIFTTIALVGYPLILRRVARNRAADEERADEDGDGAPGGRDGDGDGDPAGPDARVAAAADA